MKFVLVLFIWIFSQTASKDLFLKYRINLAKAPTDKEICFTMLKELQNKKDSKSLAYLGAYQMIKANHVFSPISKLKLFRMGKNKLEQAIKDLPEDVELRYIRYAIQISVPSLLNYNDHIEQDKKWMINKLEHQNKSLQADIKKLLQHN